MTAARPYIDNAVYKITRDLRVHVEEVLAKCNETCAAMTRNSERAIQQLSDVMNGIMDENDKLDSSMVPVNGAVEHHRVRPNASFRDTKGSFRANKRRVSSEPSDRPTPPVWAGGSDR